MCLQQVHATGVPGKDNVSWVPTRASFSGFVSSCYNMLSHTLRQPTMWCSNVKHVIGGPKSNLFDATKRLVLTQNITN